jgi:hypothetical protein
MFLKSRTKYNDIFKVNLLHASTAAQLPVFKNGTENQQL